MALSAKALVKAGKAFIIQKCVILKKQESKIFIMELSWLRNVLFIDAMHWGVHLYGKTCLRNRRLFPQAVVRPMERFSGRGHVSHRSPCPTFSLK